MYPEVQIIRWGHQRVDKLHARHLKTGGKTRKKNEWNAIDGKHSFIIDKRIQRPGGGVETNVGELSLSVFIDSCALLMAMLEMEEWECARNKVRGNSWWIIMSIKAFKGRERWGRWFSLKGESIWDWRIPMNNMKRVNCLRPWPCTAGPYVILNINHTDEHFYWPLWLSGWVSFGIRVIHIYNVWL